MFIRRIVLVLLVLSCSGLAQAEWIAVVEVDSFSGGVTVYVDPTTRRIDQKSGLVKMWVLQDFNTVQTFIQESYLSSSIQDEYDCKEEKKRILTGTYFEGNMANGKVVYNYTGEVGPWMPIAPGTLSATSWNVACNMPSLE